MLHIPSSMTDNVRYHLPLCHYFHARVLHTHARRVRPSFRFSEQDPGHVRAGISGAGHLSLKGSLGLVPSGTCPRAFCELIDITSLSASSGQMFSARYRTQVDCLQLLQDVVYKKSVCLPFANALEHVHIHCIIHTHRPQYALVYALCGDGAK